MNSLKIAIALRALAEAFEDSAQDTATPPPQESGTQKRGRGRPVKGEEIVAAAGAPTVATNATPAATPAANTAATPVEADPFVEAASKVTLDDVRKVLTDLRAASSQEKALAVLKKSSGSDNLPDLTADKYAIVVAAANVELRLLENAKAAPVAAADPFAADAAPAEAAKAPTLEDVKAAVVDAQKRTASDVAQKVVMSHGGKAANPEGIEGPSLKALPASKYAVVIRELKALPTTK